VKLQTQPVRNARSGAMPRWVIYTCSGCALFAVLAAGGLFFGGKYINDKFIKPGLDSEANWPKLQSLLPFEQRPAGMDLQFAMDIAGVQMFVLQQARLQVLVMNLPEAEGKATKDAVTDPSSYKGLMGMGERKNAQKMSILLQGVDRKGMRFLQEGVPGAQGSRTGASVILDVSPEGTLRPLLVQLTRNDGSEEPIADDEIHRFFEPFRVGQR